MAKKKARKSNAGAPSKFKEEYIEQVYKLSLIGMTDAQLAKYFEVAESTINDWKIKFPKFSESIKKGKEIADGEVAASLFNRAIGYQTIEEEAKVINGEVVMTPILKKYPPDTTAAIYWMKNRQSENWRDKQEVEHKGESMKINIIKNYKKK